MIRRAAVPVLLALLALSGLLAACDDESPTAADVPYIAQKYLLDTYYVNFASGYNLHGLYIDNEGYLIAYDHGFEVWMSEDPLHPTAAELDDKYSAPTDTLGRVDLRQLYRQYLKFEDAAQGELTDLQQVAADMGARVWCCYLWDEAAGAYDTILLTLSGDFVQENLAPEAAELKDWFVNQLPD